MTRPDRYILGPKQVHQYHTTVARDLLGTDMEAICPVCHPPAAKANSRKQRQAELLAQMPGDYYQEKHVGRSWLVKHFDKANGIWVVAVYNEASFEKYKQFNYARRVNTELDDQLAQKLEQDK